MSLDISCKLIVGVPLVELGTIEQEGKEIKLTNLLGQKTGEVTTLITVYLTTPKTRWLIGSNEKSILDDYRPGNVLYYYHDDTEWSEKWVHTPYGDNPKTTVIGLEVNTILGDKSDRWEGYRMATMTDVASKIAEVGHALLDKFGYAGGIYVISLVDYSY